MARESIEHLYKRKLQAPGQPTYNSKWSNVQKFTKWWTLNRKNATMNDRRANSWSWKYWNLKP